MVVVSTTALHTARQIVAQYKLILSAIVRQLLTSLLYSWDICQYCVKMPNFLEIKLAIFYIQFYKFCFLQFCPL